MNSDLFDKYFFDLTTGLVKKGLTLGLEQEFFLVHLNGKPADLKISQFFFQKLIDQKYLQVREKHENYFLRLGIENSNDTYNSLKYEFPPHLLEISYGHFTDLNQLNENVQRTMQQLDECAFACDLRVLNVPHFNQAKADLSILRELNHLQLDLFRNRQEIAKTKGIFEERIAQFPAYIASTQFHIGGLNWAKDSHIINSLYSFEPFICYLAHKQCEIKLKTKLSEIYQNRWLGYQSMFDDTSLFGIPKESQWSFEHWKNNFSNNYNTPNDVINDVKNKRDLSFIKPRHIGTLEFRSLPALSSTKEILRFAAYRLAQSLLAKENKTLLNDLGQVRSVWDKIFLSPEIFQDQINLFKKLSFDVLVARDKGEERYLSED